MITIRTARTQKENTASGFLRSLFMPSLKKVVDSAITSVCFFSSSVAFSNNAGSIWRLKGCFFGAGML